MVIDEIERKRADLEDLRKRVLKIKIEMMQYANANPYNGNFVDRSQYTRDMDLYQSLLDVYEVGISELEEDLEAERFSQR
ncbi:MAG: hypothetical protein GX951_04950 [Mollicutes bacterium]|nr:hypothetical protein [Mollicutes bacterium]